MDLRRRHLALIFGASAFVVGVRRHRERPLRVAMRARPAMFQAAVDVKASLLGLMVARRGSLDLHVYLDEFRVVQPFPSARLLFGQDYCYRSRIRSSRLSPGRCTTVSRSAASSPARPP